MSARKLKRAATDPYSLKEGNVDPETNATIRHIVAAYATCIVYVDSEGYIQYWCTPDHDWPDEEAFADIESRITEFQGAVKNQLGTGASAQFAIQIGQVIEAALESGNFEGARRALQNLHSTLKRRVDERMRLYILKTSLIAASVLLLVGVGGWLNRRALEDALGVFFMDGFFCAIAGALGASFSIVQRTNTLTVAPESGSASYIVECLGRIFLGAFAGTVVYLACISNIALGFLSKLSSTEPDIRIATLLLVAAASGVSERMLGSLVGAIEKKTGASAK